jgi:hypothetical protein
MKPYSMEHLEHCPEAEIIPLGNPAHWSALLAVVLKVRSGGIHARIKGTVPGK